MTENDKLFMDLSDFSTFNSVCDTRIVDFNPKRLKTNDSENSLYDNSSQWLLCRLIQNQVEFNAEKVKARLMQLWRQKSSLAGLSVLLAFPQSAFDVKNVVSQL